MKNTNQKNNSSTSIFTIFFLLFFMGSSQWGNAQKKDPLIIEKGKVKINTVLEVNGPIKATSLEAASGIFKGNLQGTSATFSSNLAVNKAIIAGGANDWNVLYPRKEFTGSIHLNPGVKTGKNYGSAITFGAWDTGNGANAQAGIYTRSDKSFGTQMFFATTNIYAIGAQTRMMITNDGNVGIGTTTPISNLDISGGARTSTHPTNVPGLYVTGNFGAASSGVEFRHANGSQGIGFGYNTIYATGFNANQNLNLKPRGTGKVGIGTTNPKALLHVARGAYTPGYTIGASLMLGQNNVLLRPVNFQNFSIMADGDVLSKTQFISVSDIRIKKNIHATSTADDLQSLKAIDIVNYEMIDDIADNRKYKKVVAQQLQEVYPIAVQQEITSFIPSVFQASLSIDKVATDEYQLIVTDKHSLALNDQVDLKCYPDNSSVTAVVSKIISPTEFVVQSTAELDKMESIFVYGKQIDDLLSVDYDAIGMLNVSATQELAKQMEQLRAENQAQATRIAELEKQVESLEGLKASVAQLQAMMQSSNKGNFSSQSSKK